MIRHRLFPLAPFLLLALAATGPLAATSVVGTGTPASCTEAALDAAIAEANGESGLVLFDCGAAPHTILLTTTKTLGQGVAIDGGGKITLEGDGNVRLLQLAQGVAVQIANIALVRGFANPGGGCILAFSTSGNPSHLVLGNVTFSECRAGEFGGAIASNFNILTVSDSTFADNTANSGGGGAISVNNSNVFLERSRFYRNIAAVQGGAIQAWFSELTIEESELEANRANSTLDANGGGGAIAMQSAGAIVRDSDFFLNVAERHGAALLLLNSSDATLEDSRLYYNGAARSGAGVYADASSVARLERCSLWGNVAQSYGGALFGRNFLEVRNCTFYENVALIGGTAIFTEVGTLRMVSSTLVDNHNPVAPGSTGQLAWSAGTTIEVHNTLIQSPLRQSFACAPSGPASFTATTWDDFTCPEGGAGSRVNTIVGLRPFGYSCGGAATELTPTAPLAPGSPALIAGSCRLGDPVTDQRGMPRPNGAGCDIGAAEFFEPCDAPFFIDGFETANTQRWSATLQ